MLATKIAGLVSRAFTMQCDNLTEVSLKQLTQANGWQAQYRVIIQWGRLIELKPGLRQEQHLIKGCETPAWLAHSVHDGRNRFVFDSDSRVINGLVALLLSIIDNKTTSELVQLSLKSILLEAGFEKHLSPSRSNGLRSIIMRAYTMAECKCIIE